MTAPLQFAIVGSGVIGRKRAAWLKPGQLRYACDLDASRAAELARTYPGAIAITDYQHALADPTVSAVIVATLNGSLAPIALAAVREGKHVLVEKPGAINSAQLRQVHAAAEHSGARVRLGYNHRFHPAVQKARELADSDALG